MILEMTHLEPKLKQWIKQCSSLIDYQQRTSHMNLFINN